VLTAVRDHCLAPARSVDEATAYGGRYRRLFPDLPPVLLPEKIRLRQFDDRPARGLIRLLQGADHRRLGDAERAHAIGVEDDLVLTHHAADARDLGDVRHRLQLESEKPVVE